MTVDLGVLVLPEHQGPRGADVWRGVEELGVAHAWTFDHLSWRLLRTEPWFDAFVTLTAAACVTERVELGTLVTTPNFRHPVLTAKQAMSLDHVSGGRFVLGVGAGVPGPDTAALGGGELPTARRMERFEEFVDLVDRLLRQPATTFRGTYFDAVDIPMRPGCLRHPRPPLALAASGPRGMRTVARHADIWVSNGPPPDVGPLEEHAVLRWAGRQAEQVDEVCAAEGRAPGSLRKLLYVSRAIPDACASPQRLCDLVSRCAELGFTDVVLAHPRPRGVFAQDMAVFKKAVTAWTR
ncbi:LLM class flavin-dependent oxidoreductase [Streptomyces sp. NRRL B-1347]|uniref:LLM class flavin-dependent oxidoreductase n=1 Tax=Streptomyces sp. NRRL B-1347 TaxID=1476877 RepID=UPI0004C4CB91|nr:LLM class flavin-dependent oxidoreductase [Streptomyces sp. NRRL B-1347]